MLKTIFLLAAFAAGAIEVQSVPCDCVLNIEVNKQGSSETDFNICFKTGHVCTSRDVPTCYGSFGDCVGFGEPYDLLLSAWFPNAFAEVCWLDDTEEQCLCTDIVYGTCEEATEQNRELCLPLSNGELECAEIPEEQIQLIQNYGTRYKTPDRIRPKTHVPSNALMGNHPF